MTPVARGLDRVLVVEDHDEVRHLVAGLLGDYFDVLQAPDGQAALELAVREQPDVVLCDIRMPRMDGFGVLAGLRTNVATASIPVIFLSASAGPEARLRGFDAGASDYVEKPFNNRELLARVQAQAKLARARRLAELREITLRAELNEIRGRFDSIVGGVSDQIFMLDREWRFTYVNAHLARASGIAASDLMGKVVWELFPDLVGTVFEREVRRAAESAGSLHFDYYYPRWKCWYANHVYPSPAGLLFFVVHLGSHIDACSCHAAPEALADQVRDLEASLARRTGELHDARAELELFSYSLSHDLRGPLRSMHGFAQLLAEQCGERLGAVGHDCIKRILTSAERLDRLIQDILAYNRFSRATMPHETIDVGHLLAEVVDSYPLFRAARAAFELPATLPSVRGNRAALTICLSHLLDNALKFIPPGVAPRVRIGGEARGRRVRLWVQDNGIGIDPAGRDKIFGIFYQASHDYAGTGMGLPLVRKAAHCMGGEVGFESEPGAGSTFFIELDAPEEGSP